MNEPFEKQYPVIELDYQLADCRDNLTALISHLEANFSLLDPEAAELRDAAKKALLSLALPGGMKTRLEKENAAFDAKPRHITAIAIVKL